METSTDEIILALRKIEKYLKELPENYRQVEVSEEGSVHHVRGRDMIRETIDMFEESRTGSKVANKSFTFLPESLKALGKGNSWNGFGCPYLGIGFEIHIVVRRVAGEVTFRTISLFSEDPYIFDRMGTSGGRDIFSNFQHLYSTVNQKVLNLLTAAAKRNDLLAEAGFDVRVKEKAEA